MAGVIWVVQLIVYPGFLTIDPNAFATYHSDYSNRVTWIVGPAMVFELITAAALSWILRATTLRLFLLLNLVSVLALWFLTAFLQVPQHATLTEGFDTETIHDLVDGNWFRTAIWTLRVVILSTALPSVYHIAKPAA